MKITRLLVAFLPFLLAACSDESGNEKEIQQVAVSKGDQLTSTELELSDYATYFSGRSKEQLAQLLDNEHLQREVVLDYHSDVVLANYAEGENLDETDEYERRLANAKRQILINLLTDSIKENFEYPSDEELEQLAREHYALHKDNFKADQRRRVAHILLKDTSDCPCETRTVRERLSEIQQRLAEDEDFASLAREFSDDPGSADAGGELPILVGRDRKFAPIFEEWSFHLKEVGELSEPFETQFGTHIVKLLEIIGAGTRSFEEVRDAIIELKKKELVNSKIEKLRSSAYPDIKSIQYDQLNNLIKQLLDNSKNKG